MTSVATAGLAAAIFLGALLILIALRRRPEPRRQSTAAGQRRVAAPAPRSAAPDDDDDGDLDDLTRVTVTVESLRGASATDSNASPATGGDASPSPAADPDAKAAPADSAPGSDDDRDETRDDTSARAMPHVKTHAIFADADAEIDSPTRPNAMFLVSGAAQTDRGKKRKNNEDRCLVVDSAHVYGVADGMGGYAGGEIASQLAVDTIASSLESPDADANVAPALPVRAHQLAVAVQAANLAIWRRAKEQPELKGMGTTVVAGLFALRKNRLYIAHVGDSRCYRLRRGELVQLTTDHTLGGLGLTLTPAQAAMLTRAVGVSPRIEIDVVVAKPVVGDVYLFCSDGLSKMVPADEIADLLRSERDVEIVAQALVDRANERGGKDNVTTVVVAVEFVNAAVPG